MLEDVAFLSGGAHAHLHRVQAVHNVPTACGVTSSCSERRRPACPSRGCKAIHGYKAQVSADADTAIVVKIAVTPGNAHGGRSGHLVLPDDPGEVFADSAYRGQAFAGAVSAKGGTPRVAAASVWAKSDPNSQMAAERWLADWNGVIRRVRGRIKKIFGTWNRSYGVRRMRWRGLAKAVRQTHLAAIAYNFRRTTNILRPI